MPETMTIEGLLKLMREMQGEQPQNEFARILGVSPQYLNDVYNSRCLPGPKILNRLNVTSCYSVPDKTLAAAANPQKRDQPYQKRRWR